MQKSYYVYLIATKRNDKIVSYVGYTDNISRRIKIHNLGKGAKFTRGNFWSLIYKKRFKTKSLAMKGEYNLKKNYLLRKEIKQKYFNE